MFLSACGKGGGVLLFTVSPFGASSSGSGSTALGSSTAGLEADGLTYLPLLNVTTIFTSSILGFGSLAELNSCTPLGFGCVCDGNFPFSRTCCWLVNLETEYYKSSSAEILHQGAKFLHRDAKNLVQLIFCSSSAPDFKSVKLVLARIRRAWIDSTNLALKACKNYKISHKMRSVE